jgi:hypothetical protein
MNPRHIIIVTLGLCGTAASLNAAITGVSGQATWLVTPPASAWLGALSGPNAYVWNERQNRLTGWAPVNINVNPSVNTGYTPQLNSVSAPAFDSHMIHFDPGAGPLVCKGSVTFATPILGVIYSGLWINGTDAWLGSPSTTYYTWGWGRSHGMFLAQSVVSVSGNTLTYELRPNYAGILMSELRVLTRPVPAPSTLAVVALLGLTAGRRRR